MLVAIGLLALVVLLYHLYVYRVRSRVAHIPGPPQHWFYLLGNAQELIKSKRINQRRLIVRYFKRFGPVFKIVVFHKVLLFCYGPEVNRRVFSSRFQKPESVYSMMHSMFGVRFMGRSFLTETDQQRWRERRRRVRTIFGAGFANASADAVNTACSSLVRLLGGLADTGRRLQLEAFLGKATLEVTCQVGFSFGSGALDSEEASSSIEGLVQGAMEGIAIKTESPLAWLGRPAKVAEVRDRVLRLRHLLADHVSGLESAAGGDSFDDTGSMMSAMVSRLAGHLSKEELVDEAVTLFSAGQETTASLLASLFMELGRQPGVTEALVAEIETVCNPSPSAPISLADLSRMRYLDAVVKETLRLYPPAPMVTRVATEANGPVKIGGHAIPPGYPLYLSMLATHMLCFKDGKRFKPERFLGDRGCGGDDVTPSAFTYGPFGFGERACAGQRLALLTAKLLAAHLLRAFRLRYPPDLSFHTVQVGSLKPLHGVPVTLETRQASSRAA